jgi:hypothetical protein
LVQRRNEDLQIKKLFTNYLKNTIMKKVTFKVITVLALSLLTVNTFATVSNDEAKHDVKVTINAHSLVGISSTNQIDLSPVAPEVAGEGLNFDTEKSTNSSIWLNYSSIVEKNANSISVSMDGDKLPEGVTIELVAGNDAGKGMGEVGQSSNKPVVLSKEAQTLISGIKNCYTGTGEGAGHQLTYSLKMKPTTENYKALTSGSYTTTILYTITDN